jgi:glycosyltransferase involved in cell wall biosynthesis
MPRAGWLKTIQHGIPHDLLRPLPVERRYLAFLGRIAPEKCVDRAIAIAARCGLELKIAAKVDPADRKYFEAEIKPLLSQPHVEFIGEIGDSEKSEFLSGALGLLVPIDWPEPFGLVMIEAMACGTPVVAFNRGSVPEIVDDGITGFIVEDVDGGVAAVHRLSQLSRTEIRSVFERRFTARRMAGDYIAAYESLTVADLRKTATNPRLRAV